MALSLYVMPLTGSATRQDPARPKYRDSQFPLPLESGMWNYGNEPWCVAGIKDVPPAVDAALDAEPDVLRVPANLDQPVGSGAALTRARNGLEAVNIPGLWIQPTTTWREVVTFTGAVCQFAKRYRGIDGTGTARWFSGGVTLATTYGSLPTDVRQMLSATALSFSFDTSGITAATTLRQLLTEAATQYNAQLLPLTIASTDVRTA